MFRVKIMLCQNCNRNDATTHLKRIINGEAAEVHLCSSCALSLGVADAVSAFSAFGEIPGNIFSSGSTVRINSKTLRCETCGFTYEDIMRTGMPGCPECYRVFGRRLRAAVTKIHGRAVYMGKIPSGVNEEIRHDNALNELKEKLNKAIDEQNFELAAVLRDEIKKMTDEVNG